MSSFENEIMRDDQRVEESLKKKNLPWDCIVIGLGGHGSATIAHLAMATSVAGGERRRVLGIEQYSMTHGYGSSHGRSRIIRQAYFEDPRYVPLVQRSFELWRELSKYEEDECLAKTGHKPHESLLNMTGGLMIGSPDSIVVQGTLKSINSHGLSHEIFSSSELQKRYPIFTPSPETIGVFETEAGYLIPEACISTYCALAQSYGATLQYGESMISYRTIPSDQAGTTHHSDLIEITTSNGIYLTKKLVLTVGAWAPQVYGSSISLPLRTERRVLYWFRPSTPELCNSFKDIPVYIWDTGSNQDIFYGFPMQDGHPENSVKVAVHITERDICSPSTINRTILPEEVNHIRSVLMPHIPSLSNGELIETATCLYTITPDEHFLIDFHPTNSNIVLASPCSGHGFKFCSVVGEIIKDLILSGSTLHDISLFLLNKERETSKSMYE